MSPGRHGGDHGGSGIDLLLALAPLRASAAACLSALLEEQARDFPKSVYVRQVLSVPGKLLGPDEGFTWGLLPLLVCEAAGGDPRRGLSLGAAFDCFIAAADIFDDIQDDDDDAGLQRTAGPATAINVAAFLLFLSQHTLGPARYATADGSGAGM